MMKVGDKVRVKDQEITGIIIRFDWNGDVVILDDCPEWQEEGEEPSLIFKQSEVENYFLTH